MFSSFALTALLVSSSAFFARADVTPNGPGPNETFNEGSTCTVSWLGDTDSKTTWKDMSIQLMSGSNFGMVHLTTVTSNQDGTVDGSFPFTCPDVDPYSAIYFYQFTAPAAVNKTWTTRFTIASASGTNVPPVNALQPGTNAPIPWGTGVLADPSKAVPPPPYLNDPSSSPANITTTPATSSGSTSSSSASSDSSKAPSLSPAPSPPPSSAPTSQKAASTNSNASNAASTTGPSTSSNSTNASASADANSAPSSLVLNSQILQAATALGFAATAFAFFL